MEDEFSWSNIQNQVGGKLNRLVPLNSDAPGYLQVQKRFRKGWKHPDKPLPYVHFIFRIASPDETLEPYLKYRARIHAATSTTSNFKHTANEKLLFHGTNRSCRIAEDTQKLRLCGLADCYLCSIIRKSYDVHRCGSKHKFRRFGTGIYTTSCSSKADDYLHNVDNNSALRVMLVNRVVLGKAHKRRHNATHLSEPPRGHHSVVGVPGGDLNYRETVVYNNDAIRPAYLIVYGAMPPAPIPASAPVPPSKKIPSMPSAVKAMVFLSTLFNTPLAS
ncbi:hypothetical protein BD779DRAFT_559143 [Infundibulicybe gibba]|nr:hypothetical protein BD779DRAFT_559143 [Infundibulicybe gibba]